jgi:hypothetical protein
VEGLLNNMEREKQPTKELSNEDMLTFIHNDYPQYGPGRVSSILGSIEFLPEEKVRERFNHPLASLLDIDEYIDSRLCVHHPFHRPEAFSEEVQARIEAINADIKRLKQAILDEKPLKEIYQLTKEIGQAHDMRTLTIAQFED